MQLDGYLGKQDWLNKHSHLLPREDIFMISFKACGIDVDTLSNNTDMNIGYSNPKYRNFLTQAPAQFDKIISLINLSKREEQIIRLIYLENHTHEEVAREMGVVRSRITQIHTNVIRRFRNTMMN